MPRGVYRSEPANRLGRWAIGTTFDLERPVMSIQPPTAYCTPSAASRSARATWSGSMGRMVSTKMCSLSGG